MRFESSEIEVSLKMDHLPAKSLPGIRSSFLFHIARPKRSQGAMMEPLMAATFDSLPVQRIFVDVGKHTDTPLTANLSASACGGYMPAVYRVIAFGYAKLGA